MQYAVSVRNAKLDAIETAIGPSPVMQIFTGEKPLACASPNSGELLATIYLPNDWMLPASGGSKSIAGEWVGIATGFGEPGHFRLFQNDGPCKLQGTIGSDMKLNERVLSVGQIFTVTTFTVRDNNG